MKRLFSVVVVAALASLGFAQAQTAVYYADDLMKGSKSLAVSPGYLTVVEFFDEVDQISSGRPDLIRVEVASQKVYVSTNAKAGATDLVVDVGGRTQLFRVSVVKGDAPRRYVVRLERPAPVVTKPAPKAAPKPAPVKAAIPKPVVKPAPKPVAVKPAPKPVAQVAPKPAAKPAPVAPKPALAVAPTARPAAVAAAPAAAVASRAVAAPVTPDGAVNPSWLQLIVVRVDASVAGQLTVYYAVRNTGARQILMDPAGLKVRQGGRDLEPVVYGDPGSVILRPGRSHLGRIVLRGAGAGAVALSWTVLEPLTKKSYTLERTAGV